MKYRILGKSELKVTQIGLGGIPIIPLPYEEAERCVLAALDCGINFIDTANAYSDSEEKIGRALKTARRDREKIILATKAQPRSREFVAEALEQSLRALRTDYIDLYQFHNISRQETLDKSLEIMETLYKFREQGKIRHIGASVHGVEWVNTVIRCGVFETVMIAVNFIVREPVDVVLPVAREHNVGVLAMKPMGGGQIDNPELAFRFFLPLEDIVPLVGVKTPEEIREVVEIIEKSAPPDEDALQEMERIRKETGTLFCRRCGYCIPCPHGVDIVTLNIFESIIKRYPVEPMLKSGIEKSLKTYDLCEDCGECETRCPYHLNIRQMMKYNYEIYREIVANRECRK
jgi:hypothetical protein